MYEVVANTNSAFAQVTIDAAHNLDLLFFGNAPGMARITVRATDPLGAFADEVFWLIRAAAPDVTPPTVEIVDVAPDPSNQAVSKITIVFSEPVSGFDLADLVLTRDGGANLLTAAQTLTTSDDTTWVLGNLSELTGVSGNYSLSLLAGGSGIADLANNALTAGASDEFAVSLGLAGDYNRDGSVDAADYVVWRKAFGTAVPPSSGADGTGDGNVNEDDYPVWTTNFGTTQGSGAAAPSELSSAPQPEPALETALAAGMTEPLVTEIAANAARLPSLQVFLGLTSDVNLARQQLRPERPLTPTFARQRLWNMAFDFDDRMPSAWRAGAVHDSSGSVDRTWLPLGRKDLDLAPQWEKSGRYVDVELADETAAALVEARRFRSDEDELSIFDDAAAALEHTGVDAAVAEWTIRRYF